MPTLEENIMFLYLVLTEGGTPVINWDAVSTALSLKKPATQKRWSRLQKSMQDNVKPAPWVYPFLWLCVKHSARDKTMNWASIASKSGTTSGAASKRYSRMKQAFESGVEAPGLSPVKSAATTPSKPTATPPKPKNAARSPAKLTPKRKRTAAGRKVATWPVSESESAEEDGGWKSEASHEEHQEEEEHGEEEEEEEESPLKKPKPTPRTFSSTAVSTGSPTKTQKKQDSNKPIVKREAKVEVEVEADVGTEPKSALSSNQPFFDADEDPHSSFILSTTPTRFTAANTAQEEGSPDRISVWLNETV